MLALVRDALRATDAERAQVAQAEECLVRRAAGAGEVERREARAAAADGGHPRAAHARAQEEAQRQEMIEAERRARMRHRTLKPLVDANGRGLADKARRTRRSRSAVAEVRPGSRTSNESPIFAKTLALFGPASQVPASLLRPREGARRKSSTGASLPCALCGE